MGSAVIPPPPGFELDDEFVPPPPGFELDSVQPPVAPIPVRPRVSDPFSPEQSWIREQAATKRPSFNSPVKDPSPVVQDRPGPEAVRPMAPTSIPPTVETTPVGRANAPVPGRIPGMERLGGAAPGVPPVTAQINETNAPSLAGDVGGGFVRGVASGAMAVPRALSRVPGGFRDDINSLRRTRADIEPNLGFRTPEQVAEDDARLRQISNSDINRFEQAALPAAPVTGAGKFAEALGSTAPYMAAGVAGPAGPAALGILAGTEESLGRSDASGIPLSDAQRLGVGAAGAAIGSTEALPFGRLLGRLKGAGVISDAVDETQLVKQLFPGLKDYAVSAGKQAIEEGVQEGTSNILQDATEASYGGRPVNRIGEGLGEAVTTGGGVGALVDVLTTLAGSRAGRARLSQNGVDPAALLAWVQAQEKVDPMQAEFNTLARENRAPSSPQAAPPAAPTPTPAESPAPAPPQQAEAATQVPPPPAGFTVDPLPGAIESDPAAESIPSSEASEMPAPVKQDAAPDDAYRAVIDFAAAEGEVSVVKLQKQFKMPFGDAVRMMQRLEADGQIEPPQGRGKQKFIGQQAAQPVPAPGPREEVVQPVPVDAAASVAAGASEPNWKPIAAKWQGDAAGAVDYQWKIGENRSYEMVPFGNEDQARLIRKWDGEEQDLGVVGSLEEAGRIAKQDASEMFAYDQQEQEPDAPLSPEVAAPPSAVEAAAPEAQPPAAPKEPPAGVAASVKRYLETISDVNRQLAEARTVDDKFGGEGRYENEVWDRLMGEGGAVTAEANKKLQVFRELAVKNGVDAEAFIEKMGGMPESPALSERAKKYRGESVPPALESPGERSEAEAAVEDPVAPPAPEQPKDFQWNGPVPNFENFKGRQANPAPDAPPPADSRIVYGRRAPAKTARGYKVETNFAVVPMASLRISNSDNGEVNTNYPAELQPRQRDRKSSDEQIQEIIAQFDPDQLAENYLATDGAPIIGEDLAVESGNGRSMALRRIYERFPQKAKLYQDWLVENADRFGIDPEALAGIENPVLVRVRKTLPKGVSRTDFGRDANERTTGGMSPAEQAAIDARGLDPEIMRLFQPSEDGKINTMANAPFVRAFFASIVPGPDRQTLRDGEGNINPAGIKRIENAIFAKAYGDRGMIEKMAEDPDDNIKSVVGAMLSAANRFISMRNAIENGDLHSRDISADLTAAAKILSNLRFEGKSIDDYLNQVDMFGRPKIQDAILATLRDLGRSKAKFLDILNQYVDVVEAAGNPKQEGMFGPAEPPPPPLAIWSSIVERAQANGQGNKDASPEGGLDASSPEGGDGSGKGTAKKGRRAEGEQGQSGRPADSGRAGNTVEKTKDGLQETLVTDLEARESQIAANNDSNRPLVDMPFSLSAPEAPVPTGPDPRQDSMFGEQGDSEVVGYAPKGTLGAKPPSNGGRGKKTTPPTGPRTGTAVSRSEIVKNLSSFLNNIPIRTGGFRERAAGIFKVRQNVIRTAKALDLETISHEIGHAIHKYLWGTRKGSLVALNLKPLRPFKNELGLLDYDQNKQRAYEGFAEYIRLRITKPAEAKQRAPRFHTWFNQKLSEAHELADVLKKAQEQYSNWDIQPSTVKLAKSIDTKPNHESFIKRVTDGMSDFRYNWIDDKTGLRDAVDLFQKLGATVADTANAYRLARTLSGTFTRANFAITNKTVGADNAPNGAGLGEILKPIADRDVSERNPAFQKLVDDWGIRLSDDGKGDGMDDFRVYIVARRLLDYRDKGLETGFTLQELKRAVADTETDAVKAAAEELHEYSGRILDYAYEKGAMTEETREAIRSKNEFYVPLHRVMDNVSAEDAKAMLGRKMLDLNSPVLKRKGSTREIIDPLESVIKNTYAIMSFADRNAVAQALVKQAERVSDQGYLVESGIVNPMKATTFNLKEVGKDIMAALEEAGIDGSELELDHMSTIFRPNMDPRRSNGVVRVIVDGVPKLFQMDKNLIRALDNTDAQSADLWNKMAANAAGALRFGATAGNPEFIATNFFRDQFMAGIQSRNAYIPIVSGMWGAFKIMSDPKAFQEWQLAGGATAAMMPLTRKNLRLTVDKVTKSKKDLVLTHPAQIFPLLRDALTFFGEKSEASTRYAEYLLAKGRGKSTAEAAFDSRDVSLDFERMGKIAKTVNQFVPFFSVALNASERFVEMHNPRNKKQFAKSLAKGFLGITIPTMMLWLLNKDDEEYKNVEAWKRDLFWLIPTKYLGLRDSFGPFIRIPKPPMWGQLYGSLFERWADSLVNHNKHAFDDFAKTAFQTILPPAQIQAIKPFEEVFSNYNAFTDRPIETAQMQKLSAENRYTPTTSELSKGMSKVIGGSLSPVQVEHLLLGYTAGLGRVAITGGEELAGLRKDRPAMEASERPFIRAFATPSSPYLSTNFKLFKERLEKLKQKREDFKFSKDPKYRMTSADESKLARLEEINESVNEIRSKQFKVYGNKALSRDEKRRQLDMMNKQRDEILKRTKPLYD